jgi:lipoprotein-releasing system permease protein
MNFHISKFCMKFEWLVASKYLKSPQKKGFVSVIAGFSFLGIALGVATLIIVMSVMNGFREELLSRIIGMRGHVIIQGKQPTLLQDDKILSLIKKVPGVEAACPVIEKQGIALFKSSAHGIGIRALSREDLQNRKMITKNLTPKALNHFEGECAFIGRRLCERMGIKIGDRFAIITGEGHYTPFGSIPKQHKFVVGGIFEVGMHEYDKSIIFIPLSTAQKYFSLKDKMSYIEVFATHPEITNFLEYTLQKTLGDAYNVIDWRHSDASFFQAVEVERNVMFLILSLIILIAALNVISGLTMLVKDKTKDIAILRTIGASKKSIMQIFFLTGSSIGVSGTFFGMVLGLSFSLNIEKIRQFLQSFLKTDLFRAEIYFLTQLPSKVNSKEVVMIIVMALVLSFLSTLYPSWKAASLDPVEGLK